MDGDRYDDEEESGSVQDGKFHVPVTRKNADIRAQSHFCLVQIDANEKRRMIQKNICICKYIKSADVFRN